MSGITETKICPICGKKMDISSDYKPFDNVFGLCLNCGFTYWTERGQASLKEINIIRKDNDLPALKKSDIEKYKQIIKKI